MAFRRFKRAPHPLCQEYDELIDLTIELVKKIYFQPLVDIAWKEIEETRSTRNIAVEAARVAGDVHMGSVDEDREDKIITRRDGRYSRTGRVVARPVAVILVLVMTRLLSTISTSCLGKVRLPFSCSIRGLMVVHRS